MVIDKVKTLRNSQYFHDVNQLGIRVSPRKKGSYMLQVDLPAAFAIGQNFALLVKPHLRKKIIRSPGIVSLRFFEQIINVVRARIKYLVDK